LEGKEPTTWIVTVAMFAAAAVMALLGHSRWSRPHRQSRKRRDRVKGEGTPMSTSAFNAEGRTDSTAATTPPPADDPDAIRTDIEETREELGDNVQKLVGRANVKARAKDKVTEVKDHAAQLVKQQATQVKEHAKETTKVAAVRAKGTAQQTATKVRRRPAPYAGMGAVLAAAGGTVVLVRRRRAAMAAARARRWWSW
jgi:ElaB/YqjD/DUF883 family membrane-anchored ribosome-binding protein